MRGIVKKRAISPVVTSLLLIGLVIVITSVIFLWFRGIVEEGVTKFGKNIKLVCEDVEFEASYSSSGMISIVNIGNIPLYRLNIRYGSGGNFQTKDLKDIAAGWPDKGLNQGGTFSGSIGNVVGNSEKITVLPILIGTSGSGKKTFICEGQYGKEVI